MTETEKSSNLFTYAHIGIEVVIFAILAIYIYKSNSNLQVEIDALNRSVNELRIKVDSQGGGSDIEVKRRIKSQDQRIQSLEYELADLRAQLDSMRMPQPMIQQRVGKVKTMKKKKAPVVQPPPPEDSGEDNSDNEVEEALSN